MHIQIVYVDKELFPYQLYHDFRSILHSDEEEKIKQQTQLSLIRIYIHTQTYKHTHTYTQHTS